MDGLARTVQMLRRDLLVPRLHEVGVEHDMVDVKIPITGGREIVMQRYGEPKDDVALVLSQLGLRLPPQPPPKINGKTIDEALL